MQKVYWTRDECGVLFCYSYGPGDLVGFVFGAKDHTGAACRAYVCGYGWVERYLEDEHAAKNAVELCFQR